MVIALLRVKIDFPTPAFFVINCVTILGGFLPFKISNFNTNMFSNLIILFPPRPLKPEISFLF